MRLRDTVSYRIRYPERQEILAARPEAKPIAEDLWQKLNDWKVVAQRLRDDPSLSGRLRRAAFNLVLRKATGHP